MSSWNLYDSLQELKTLGLIDKKVEHKTVINLLNEEVLKYTNRRSWAKHIGVSTVFICKVLSQDSWPNKEMLSSFAVISSRHAIIFDRIDLIRYRTST